MRGNELVEGVLKEWESIVYYNWHDFSIYIFVSPCMGGSKVPPRTLYRIKCVLAEILYGCKKQNGGFYVAREKLLREACKHL